MLKEFVGDGQSTHLDINAELPTNEEILGELPLTNEPAVSFSSTEVDEIIHIDPVPGKEAEPVQTEEQDAEKIAESSPSPSEHSPIPTHTEVLETDEPGIESPTSAPPLPLQQTELPLTPS